MVLKEKKDSTGEKLNDLMIFLVVHSYAFHMTVMKLSFETSNNRFNSPMAWGIVYMGMLLTLCNRQWYLSHIQLH